MHGMTGYGACDVVPIEVGSKTRRVVICVVQLGAGARKDVKCAGQLGARAMWRGFGRIDVRKGWKKW